MEVTELWRQFTQSAWFSIYAVVRHCLPNVMTQAVCRLDTCATALLTLLTICHKVISITRHSHTRIPSDEQ